MSEKHVTVHFLGTNGWFPTETGDTPCVAIETPEYVIICDAGNGMRRVPSTVDCSKPAYLFLSHCHIDHITGLHQIVLCGFKKGLTFSVPEGYAETIRFYVNQPFTIPLDQLKFPVELKELPLGIQKDFPFGVETALMDHSAKCYGYRFDIGGKVISYCTDTGPCEGLEHLAKGADVLITECAFKSGQTSKDWPHLNPELAAEAAKKSGAKQLVLMHFDASVYPALKDREIAEENARKIFPNTIAVKDGARVRL